MISRPVHGGNLAWAAQLVGCSPDQILDFSASISPLGPPASLLDAIQANLSRLVAYPDPSYQSLCEQIGLYHQISPDWILPGNGAAELLTWAGRDFSSLSGCYTLVPGFRDYSRALTSYRVKRQGISLLTDQTWHLDLQELANVVLESSQPDWGLLLNNPHNPTGALFKANTVERLLDRLGLIVIDEAFMDFVPPEQQQSLIHQVPQCPNLVILRSLTKFYSIPGLRIGYAIAHPDRIRRWQQWRDPWSVNTLAAAAAIAALQDTTFAQHTWAWLAAARAQLFTAISQLPGFTPLPSQANFLLVQYTGSVTALQETLLRQHHIYIRDCLSFPELGDRYFRIAVRTEAENRQLVRVLEAEGAEGAGEAEGAL
ncbi:MAG: threonine-phosphate decarboxylase CobD [Cyanobacteria bacterium P01_F01_bin.4]